MERKKSMSVPEMGRLLGLGKTESYYLVKKNWFKVVTIGGKMRVMIDSFEEWYAGQNHYKKKDAADTAAERRGQHHGINRKEKEEVFRSLYLYG